MAACLRHLGGSHVGKGTGLDAAAGGRRRGVAGGESAVVLPRKEADSPVSQSVSQPVGQCSVEHWLHPSSAGGCPSAGGTRMKTFPSLCFFPSLDCLIL